MQTAYIHRDGLISIAKTQDQTPDGMIVLARGPRQALIDLITATAETRENTEALYCCVPEVGEAKDAHDAAWEAGAYIAKLKSHARENNIYELFWWELKT